MGELGELLRRAREAKGLSLAQVEEATKIRRSYLQALEDEDYDRLPPPVYAKGFLKNYARYLDLDLQKVLSLYQESEAVASPPPAPVMLDEPLEPFAVRRWWPVGLGLLIIVLIVAGWWGYQRYSGMVPFAHPTATPTLTPVPASPTPSPTVIPSPTSTSSPTPSPTIAVGVKLDIKVVGQRAWLLVRVDGSTAFSGILEPGTTRAWRASEQILLRCGNAGAVQVTVNGQELGLLGELGQVVEREWIASGMPTLTPTSTPSSTPS